MYEPKHRATRVPTTRRRAATLGAAALGAVAVGATTLTGGPAQAAHIQAAHVEAAQVRAAHIQAAQVRGALAPASSPAAHAISLVDHATSVSVAAGTSRRSAAMPSATARRAVAAAASRRGSPYRYGGAGPRAFDCSGLAKWAFAQAGKSIPRTTTAQYRASHKLPRSAKRPGDLIFYYSGGIISHVGVSAGHNKLWVARGTGTTVTLQTIYSPDYYVGRVA